MDSEKWNRVQAIFDAAAELAPEQREKFLREQCEGDTVLEEEVRSLLEADEEQYSMLDGLAVDYVSPAETIEYEGRKVGPYTLEKLIGSGGMGLVFLATRAEGELQRKVALKLIREGSLTEEIKRRFESERQILSRLDHPNIARLFDGGFSDNGYPYFTMEYVDGIPIDRYCSETKLSIKERIDLFLQVCAAVEYAQNKAVIHRDLKPTNILVTEEREVKLLDFGIAKLIAEDVTHAMTDLTRTGMRVMTPAYAAPEQVRGEAISAATDVYSLGVILYELLTDQRPYTVASGAQHELEQAICSTNPVKPSVAVITDTQNVLAEEAATVAGPMPDTTDSPSLQRRSKQLRGDLDNICLMALRKEPERRYQNATELIADIQRHLEGLPVRARASTFGYRLQKFLRRNMVSVSIGAIALLILAVTTIYYTTHLAAERDLAQLQSAKATAVSNFLTELFQIADPSETRGETVTARELLDQGAKRIKSDLAGQPQVRAELLAVIGGVYYELGLYNESLNQLEKSQALYDSLGGDHAAEASIFHAMANSADAQGFTDSSLVLFEKALMHVQQLEASSESALSEAAIETDLAIIYRHRGDYDKAESLYIAGLEVRKHYLGGVHEDVAHSLNHIGRLYYNQGMYERAEPFLREGLEIRMRLLGDQHPATLASTAAMGGLFAQIEKYDSSRVYFARALNGFIQTVGWDHPYSIGSMSSYGSVLAQAGELNSALYWHQQAYERNTQRFAPDHPRIAYPLLGLGDVYMEKGEYIEAEDYYKRALEIRNANLPATHVQVANAKGKLGKSLIGQRRFDDAKPILEDALRVYLEERGARATDTREIMEQLRVTYEMTNDTTGIRQINELLGGIEQEEDSIVD